MSIKQIAKDQIKKKVKKAIMTAIKPFLPYIILVLGIFFAVLLIIDAIYIQFTGEDDSNFSEDELQIKTMCIQKAEYLNTCNNYLDNISKNELLDSYDREKTKQIEWAHLYSLLTFHNVSNGEKIDEALLNKVAENFKSSFKYITSKVIVEKKDEKGNWNVESETTEYLLIESNSIMGHYKYTYVDNIQETTTTKTTRKKLVGETLIGKQYEVLENYLKEEFKLGDSDLETQIQIVIQAANGFYDNQENIDWFNNNKDNYKTFINKGLVWPVPNYPQLTSAYGMRIHPISGVYKLHTGIDVGAPTGSDFVAVASGVIKFSGYSGGYGNLVIIDHGEGFETYYAHGSQLIVKTGQIVEQGESVLKVGSTGNSTGPHAHFEIRLNGEYQNPLNYYLESTYILP